jgi:hypothetical protein
MTIQAPLRLVDGQYDGARYTFSTDIEGEIPYNRAMVAGRAVYSSKTAWQRLAGDRLVSWCAYRLPGEVENFWAVGRPERY